jgi:hypothetical protein
VPALGSIAIPVPPVGSSPAHATCPHPQEHEKHTHEESICDDASTLRGVKSSQHHALRTMARAQLALGAFPSIWKRWSFAARVARLETMGTKPGQ